MTSDNPYTLSTTIISISLSLHLVLLAPVNSCELHDYYLVLSFLLMYSSSGLSTDVFLKIKTNINTINHWVFKQISWFHDNSSTDISSTTLRLQTFRLLLY